MAVGVAIPGVNVRFTMSFTYEIHYTVAFRGVRMDRSLLPSTGNTPVPQPAARPIDVVAVPLAEYQDDDGFHHFVRYYTPVSAT